MAREQEVTAGIRTPDQRLRVFVSSTLAELADERAAVSRAITALRMTPVMFELGARPYPPQELYRAYLAQSDIFIGLYWQSYGWVGPEMDISGLEDEFRLSGSIPRLLYIKSPAPDREPRLTAMIEELQAEGTEAYRSFKTPRELGRLVRDDLAVLLSERFVTSGGATGTPAPSDATERPMARSLPVSSTSLIGRDDDIAEVADLLASPDVRLLTLTGPGGIGKTRLAVAAAERIGDGFPSGAVFVPLASVEDPTMVLPRIAAALGVALEGTQPVLDVLVEQIAGTPTFLVLDNLEQVVAVAPQVDELLARCPGLEVLATSRTALRIRAEREFPVDTLAVPELSDSPSLDELAEAPAVRLFVDRAQAVRRDFQLTEENAAAVAAICRRLDGLPLAIELAAARTRLLDPGALLKRLEDRIDALGTGPVDLPERQRTLRATVEWSMSLLDEREQQFLSVLSVFADGWTLDAAVNVSTLDEDSTLDLLDVLAGHSLVSIVPTDAGPRFRMLVAVREVAAERLAAGPDAADVARRHAQHFGALIENAEWPIERQFEWAERLRADEENLRVAIRWYLANDVTPLPHMFRILWLFWQIYGRMPEARAWIAEAQRQVRGIDDAARAELMFTSAVTAVEVGDDETALAALDDLRDLEGRIGDAYLESAAALALSWILPLVDDGEGALETAVTALEGFRELDDPFKAFAALTVGMVQIMREDYDAARAPLDEVVELGRRFGNSWLETIACTQLAWIAASTGQLREARARLTASVDTGDVEPSTLTLSYSLVAAAQVARAEGDARRAAVALGATEGIRQRAGLRAWPSSRRREEELVVQVADALGADEHTEATAAGRTLGRGEAVALVRAISSAP